MPAALDMTTIFMLKSSNRVSVFLTHSDARYFCWLVLLVLLPIHFFQNTPHCPNQMPNLVNIADQWYRVISSAFLHGSVMHLFFNMYSLRQVQHM
jgi:membrane associated rhomboid family serine protease